MKLGKGKPSTKSANSITAANTLARIASDRVSKNLATHHADLLSGGVVLEIVDRPKDLPAGLLAFVDEDTVTIQIVPRDERNALRAQFRQGDPGISAAEEEVLRRGGASHSELALGPTMLAISRSRSQEKFRSLLRSSLSVAETARRLDLTDGRIRQLLLDGRLYGFKRDGGWRIPSFQFQDAKVVPGIGEINVKIRRNLSPLAVYNWFTTPNPDLRTAAEEEEGFTPLEWLCAGHEPEQAASLAADL